MPFQRQALNNQFGQEIMLLVQHSLEFALASCNCKEHTCSQWQLLNVPSSFCWSQSLSETLKQDTYGLRMQVVLAGVKRGLSRTEAEKQMQKAADSAGGQGRISEVEKDFTSQVSRCSCFSRLWQVLYCRPPIFRPSSACPTFRDKARPELLGHWLQERCHMIPDGFSGYHNLTSGASPQLRPSAGQ